MSVDKDENRQVRRRTSTEATESTLGVPPPSFKRGTSRTDGNCLFDSIALLMNDVRSRPDKKHHHLAVRAAVVAQLRARPAEYQPFWDGKKPQHTEEDCDSWDAYLEQLARPGSWGGGLELLATAQKLDRPILVFHAGHQPYVFHRDGFGAAIERWP